MRQAVQGARLHSPGDQPVHGDHRRAGGVHGLQDQHRRQHGVQAAGAVRPEGRESGGLAGREGGQGGPQLHRAGRRDRVPGERGGPGHGHHGHHQAAWRQRGQLLGCGRRRDGRAGQGGLRAHHVGSQSE